MLKWGLRIVGVLVLVLGIAFWWMLLDAKAPKTATGEFDLTAYRALVAGDDPATLPSEIRLETIGTDMVPSFATEAGWFDGTKRLDYTALQLIYPGRTIVIGAAVNAAYSEEAAQSDEASFDAGAYTRMVTALMQAEQVLITHAHPDHVMAITNHPDPAALAPKLRLNVVQIATLPLFSPDGVLAPEIAAVDPLVLDGPVKVAPGLVAVPTPGHSGGSTTFYVRRADGAEYLLVGDIVWMMHNIEALRSRPRLLNFVFGLGEDRKAVQRQVRALHDLSASEPGLIIVPSHDGVYLDGLVAGGKLKAEFAVSE